MTALAGLRLFRNYLINLQEYLVARGETDKEISTQPGPATTPLGNETVPEIMFAWAAIEKQVKSKPLISLLQQKGVKYRTILNPYVLL